MHGYLVKHNSTVEIAYNTLLSLGQLFLDQESVELKRFVQSSLSSFRIPAYQPANHGTGLVLRIEKLNVVIISLSLGQKSRHLFELLFGTLAEHGCWRFPA